MKISAFILFLFSFCLIISCTKKEPVVAFNNSTMKPWFDTYCKSCHADGASDSKAWRYDANDFNNTIKKYIGDIKKEVVDRKSMPKGTALSAAELQKFVDWYNAGYPIN